MHLLPFPQAQHCPCNWEHIHGAHPHSLSLGLDAAAVLTYDSHVVHLKQKWPTSDMRPFLTFFSIRYSAAKSSASSRASSWRLLAAGRRRSFFSSLAAAAAGRARCCSAAASCGRHVEFPNAGAPYQFPYMHSRN